MSPVEDRMAFIQQIRLELGIKKRGNTKTANIAMVYADNLTHDQLHADRTRRVPPFGLHQSVEAYSLDWKSGQATVLLVPRPPAPTYANAAARHAQKREFQKIYSTSCAAVTDDLSMIFGRFSARARTVDAAPRADIRRKSS